MPFLLGRRGKKRTTWDTMDPLVVCQGEFNGFDPQVSVYAINYVDCVKAYTEHLAGNNLNPVGGFMVDLTGQRPPQHAPLGAAWPFTLTRDAHKELYFASRADLERFLYYEVLPNYSARRVEVGMTDIEQYIGRQRQAGDPEWTTYRPVKFTTAWGKLLKP